MTSSSLQLYKLDFSEEDVGKLRKESKKRVAWTFQHVVPSTEDGTPIRKTHTVSLIWSVKTGKQEVEMNNEPIWFGRKQGAAVFSHAWASREGLHLEILATTRKVSTRHVAPDFRNYDLVINGRLFNSLPDVGGSETSASPADDEPALDLPRSIVDILYPDGYVFKESPGGSMINEHHHDMEYEDYDMPSDEQDAAYDENDDKDEVPVQAPDLLNN